MLGIIIFIIWVILNGRINLEITVFGVIISCVLYGFTRFIMPKPDNDGWRLTRNPVLIVSYFFYLLGQIIIANITTIRILLNPVKKINPVLVYFDVDLKTDAAKMLLANSITITPGTITVSVRENTYCVHVLDESISEGLEENGFLTRLRKMEVKA